MQAFQSDANPAAVIILDVQKPFDSELGLLLRIWFLYKIYNNDKKKKILDTNPGAVVQTYKQVIFCPRHFLCSVVIYTTYSTQRKLPLPPILQVFTLFSQFSGFKISWDKSLLIPLND